MNVILLVGGKGSRLRPLVGEIPKPLAKFGSVNILDLILQYLDSKDEIDKVILATGYKQEEFIEYKVKNFHFQLEYSTETIPLGTAGAVYKAAKKVTSNYILVLNGDTYCEFDLPRIKDLTNDGYIYVKKSFELSRYGTVIIDPKDNRILKFDEKIQGEINFINAGIYIFKKNLIHEYGLMPQSMETEFIPKILLEQKKLYAIECAGKFIDIGIPGTFLQAENYLQAEIIKLLKEKGSK